MNETAKDFNAEVNRINDIATGVIGFSYPADPCVALEDAQPFEGQANHWDMAIFALQNAAASRIVEAGLKPSDFGLDY